MIVFRLVLMATSVASVVVAVTTVTPTPTEASSLMADIPVPKEMSNESILYKPDEKLSFSSVKPNCHLSAYRIDLPESYAGCRFHRRTVKLRGCAGHCDSYSGVFDLDTQKPLSQCRCCEVVRYRLAFIPLFCTSGSVVNKRSVAMMDVTQCSCRACRQ